MIHRTLLACLLTTAFVAAADTLSYADNGIAVTVPGPTGLVVFSWPDLSLPGNKFAKATSTKVDGNRAVLTYADGTTITALLNGGTLSLTLSQAPSEGKAVRLSASLPMSLKGASWAIGDKTGTFPPRSRRSPSSSRATRTPSRSPRTAPSAWRSASRSGATSSCRTTASGRPTPSSGWRWPRSTRTT